RVHPYAAPLLTKRAPMTHSIPILRPFVNMMADIPISGPIYHTMQESDLQTWQDLCWLLLHYALPQPEASLPQLSAGYKRHSADAVSSLPVLWSPMQSICRTPDQMYPRCMALL